MNKFTRISVLVGAVALTALAGCASTQNHEGTGQYIDDTAITTKVKAAIFNEPSLKSAEINVETFKGRVQLSGFVPLPIATETLKPLGTDPWRDILFFGRSTARREAAMGLLKREFDVLHIAHGFPGPNGTTRTLTRAAMVLGHALDMADHYSQIANYMRLNNLIPPSALPRPPRTGP